VRKPLSQRRFWNTLRSRSCRLARAISASASATCTVIGLSTTTCLPASSARLASGKWLALGLAITTSAIAGSSISASGSATAATPGRSRAISSRRLLATATSASRGSAWISGAWK